MKSRTLSSSNEEIPLILWLTGGPGCSGLVAATYEMGPCSMTEQSSTLHVNPYSWNKVAHVLFVDQPIGTGFSTTNDADNGAWTEEQAVERLYGFLLGVYEQLPALKKAPLFIFGESYGGHYVPDLAHYLMQKNEVTLSGIGIGNGLVAPEYNIKTELQYLADNEYSNGLIDASEMSAHNATIATCLDDIQQCQTRMEDDADDVCTHKDFASCAEVEDAPQEILNQHGLNPYDIRKKCHDDSSGLCYRFQYMVDLFNDVELRKEWNITIDSARWKICNNQVNNAHREADWYAETELKIPELIKQGVRVLIYAGDADSVCNWKGQEAWTNELVWEHQNEFQEEEWLDFSKYGKLKSSNGLCLLRMHDAGHMVPHDAPQGSLEMVQQFLANELGNC